MVREDATGRIGDSILKTLVIAAVVGCLCHPARADGQEEDIEATTSDVSSVWIVAPLTSEGFLWAPVLSPTKNNQITFKFGFAYHDFDYSGDDVEAFTYLLTLSGEYTLLNMLTVGVDLPFLFGYDISSDLVDDSGADFGNIRLHIRYPVLRLPELGLVLTPAFRLWLPTNTYLTVEDVPFVGELDIVDTLAVFEPILLVGACRGPASLVFETGPKFFAVDDQNDFSFWSFNLVAGYAPGRGTAGLEFILELNMLVELDEDDAPSAGSVDRAVPLALAFGARYPFEPFVAELALRVGLHEADFYYGDFNIGLQIGYVPSF